MKDNKLIAEFMGLELEETLKGLLVYAREEYNNPNKEFDRQVNFYEENELLYHFSWDWLMDVVQKINILDDYSYTVIIKSMDVEIYNNTTGKVIFESEMKWQPNELIDSVYEAVVEFIKRYNHIKVNTGQ